MRIQHLRWKSAGMTLMTAVLLFAFLPWQGDASAVGKGTISVSSVYEDSERKTVSISIEAQDIENMESGQLELRYDPQVGYVRGTDSGSSLEDAITVINEDEAEDGIVKFAWVATDEVENGTLLSLDFYTTHEQGVKATDLELVETQVFDEDGDEIGVSLSDGYIKPFDGKVESEEEVSGNKTWTIEFSTPILESSISEQSVYIQNERRNALVDVNLSLSNDGKVLTVKPADELRRSYDYSLIVSENVRSMTNTRLKEAVKVPFTVQ
ncbi:Ig-like domain-containing protein [Halobacillus litoralis]|uniref:cohesin domain-containing protein n=1 Tax=Halobacillus litoralis TaxID=45668 RepID=UPI001CD28037|nr:cohesin domain-containing protein [Halobacillus litoralis]MCA0971503.1 Ig-like domain-containing protein [Halobacillus litoralis]